MCTFNRRDDLSVGYYGHDKAMELDLAGNNWSVGCHVDMLTVRGPSVRRRSEWKQAVDFAQSSGRNININKYV